MSAAGRRTWGWHRLADPWAARIVAASPVSAGDLVFDLGAGDGALTRPLLAIGAHVVAVELHHGRAERLRALDGGLTVVQRDARDLALPGRPFRAVGNLPFRGSNAIVRNLMSRGPRVLSADLVVQRGFGLACRDGTAPGARVWRDRFSVEIERIPASAFRPPPGVETVVLRIRRRARRASSTRRGRSS